MATTFSRELAVSTDTALAALYGQRQVAFLNLRSASEIYDYFTTGGARSSFRAEAEAAKFAVKARAAKAELDRIAEAMKPLDAIFEEHKWTRAFLVVGNGDSGHVHRSMRCSTCYPTTSFVWLPKYSGTEELDIVADAGERACTVCYPSAPVDLTSRPTSIFSDDERALHARREIAAAAKVERDAKRKASAPTASGEYLLIEEKIVLHDGRLHVSRREIKTERTAISEYLDFARRLSYKQGIEADYTREVMGRIANALAGKHGVSIDEERAALAVRAKKQKGV